MTDDRFEDTKTGKRGRRSLFLFAVLVLAAAVFATIRLQEGRQQWLSAEGQARASVLKAGPRVHVVTAVRGPTERRVDMVGEARPYLQVTLFAKVSGYLREIKVDNGDRVTRGQLLAVIASPELDRQYDAAVADAKNKETEAKRTLNLVPKAAASVEQAEERDAAARVARANVAALEAQKDYEMIRAPFDGVVTARFVDPGALIQNAGNSQGAASPVVTISQVDRLKIFAYADQKNAGFIRVGNRAEIRDGTLPGQRVSAELSRTSVQLNARTRTLLLEFDVDNTRRVFVPGSFVQISLILQTPSAVQIPVEALVFRGDKPFAPVMTPENRVTLRPVVIAESDGKMVRLQTGVEEGERVILNGGNSVSEGETVQPIEPN